MDIPLTITEANGVFDTLFGIPGGRRRLYTDGELVGLIKTSLIISEVYAGEWCVPNVWWKMVRERISYNGRCRERLLLRIKP